MKQIRVTLKRDNNKANQGYKHCYTITRIVGALVLHTARGEFRAGQPITEVDAEALVSKYGTTVTS